MLSVFARNGVQQPGFRREEEYAQCAHTSACVIIAFASKNNH